MQKKRLVAIALAGFTVLGLSTTAHAALPGFYVGAQLGEASTNWSTSDFNNVQSARIRDNGFAWSPYVGYQFSDNGAIEAGYLNLPNARYGNVNGTGLNGHVTQYAVDAMLKGIVPLGNCFNLYGKAGAAYVKANPSTVLGSDFSKVDPAFGAGVSYDVTPNFPIDASFTRIQKMGGSIPSANFFAVGLQYNFG